MSMTAFLAQLRRLDVRLRMDGDELRCNAPAGALTNELREELQQYKEDIVRFLKMAEDLDAQQSAIVPLQPNGARPPVFGVPGAGDVFCFRALAQALGEEQPFFGLQPPGLDGSSKPLDRVEDLAAYFAEQIRAFRPHGPWIIAGKCVGGTVAFELAQQLLAGRESAGFLALFGAPYPTFFRPLSRLYHRVESRALLWRRRARMLATQPGRERLEYAIWRLRLFKGVPDPAMVLRAKVAATTRAAVRVYEPRPFAGRLHLFWPCEAWARRSHVQAYRWQPLAAQVETYSGPDGCMEDDMLLGPYASVFAEHFRRSRARAGM